MAHLWRCPMAHLWRCPMGTLGALPDSPLVVSKSSHNTCLSGNGCCPGAQSIASPTAPCGEDRFKNKLFCDYFWENRESQCQATLKTVEPYKATAPQKVCINTSMHAYNGQNLESPSERGTLVVSEQRSSLAGGRLKVANWLALGVLLRGRRLLMAQLAWSVRP